MSYRPIPLFFLKTSLHAEVGGHAKAGELRISSAYAKKEKQEYGRSSFQREIRYNDKQIGQMGQSFLNWRN